MTRAPLAALALSLLGAVAPPEQVRAGAEVSVTVTNLRSSEGVVRACMTRNAEIFPRCRDQDSAYRIVIPAGEAAVLHFHDVQPGTYAIALLHDENNNARADRALGMIPREGFGFSRDAKVRMGPPDFTDASFAVADKPIRQTIKMRYML